MDKKAFEDFIGPKIQEWLDENTDGGYVKSFLAVADVFTGNGEQMVVVATAPGQHVHTTLGLNKFVEMVSTSEIHYTVMEMDEDDDLWDDDDIDDDGIEVS